MYDASQLTSTPTSYSYVSGGNPPLLTISCLSSTAAVTFALNPINESTLNSSISFGMRGYPASFSSLTPPFFNTSLGYSVMLSSRSSVSNLTFQLTFPQLTTEQMALYGQGKLALLYYDVDSQSYTRLPSSSATLSSTGLLTLTANQPGYFYVLNINTQVTNQDNYYTRNEVKYLIAAQSSQTFTYFGLTLSGVVAPAGVITVQTLPRPTDTNEWLSPFFFISFSGSSGAPSGTLVYSLGAIYDDYDVSLARWYKSTADGLIELPTTTGFQTYVTVVTKVAMSDITGQWMVSYGAASSIHASHVLIIVLSFLAVLTSLHL